MNIQSENKAHNAAVAAAESTRQATVVPGATQATVTAAEIVFYRACLASAKVNGCGTSAFESALISLGVK